MKTHLHTARIVVRIPSLAPATAIGPAMFTAHCKTRVTVDQIRIFPDSAVFIKLGAKVTVTRGMARAMIVNRITATTVCLQETI